MFYCYCFAELLFDNLLNSTLKNDSSATLELNGRIRADLRPWLGDLVVDPKYQKQGIGKMLVDVAVLKAKELGFKKLYLFAFDSTIPEYYKRLGWKKIGMDEFKSHPVTVMEVEL